MQKYIVEVTATAEILECWAVLAHDAQHCQQIVEENRLALHQFVGDKVTGEERERNFVTAIPHSGSLRAAKALFDNRDQLLQASLQWFETLIEHVGIDPAETCFQVNSVKGETRKELATISLQTHLDNLRREIGE